MVVKRFIIYLLYWAAGSPAAVLREKGWSGGREKIIRGKGDSRSRPDKNSLRLDHRRPTHLKSISFFLMVPPGRRPPDPPVRSGSGSDLLSRGETSTMGPGEQNG
jgi:hypothetical protein